MENEHTKGEWEIQDDKSTIIVKTIRGVKNCKITQKTYSLRVNCQEANAKLIAEAGTVANETGFTPRQLADQKSELLEALIEISKAKGTYSLNKLEHASNTIKEMVELAARAIQKATNQI